MILGRTFWQAEILKIFPKVLPLYLSLLFSGLLILICLERVAPVTGREGRWAPLTLAATAVEGLCHRYCVNAEFLGLTGKYAS